MLVSAAMTDGRSDRRLSPEMLVFLASVMGLFLELALIRWVSSEIRIFAYCKNLVLVASFLGFGAGLHMVRGKFHAARASLLLLLLAMLVRLPWQSLQDYGPNRVSSILADLSGMHIFHHLEEGGLALGMAGKLAFAVGWTVVLFFLVALIMIPFGQAVGSGIQRIQAPLRAYSINVLGSLIGILGFSLAARLGMPPAVWFVPVALGLVLMATGKEQRGTLFGLAAALLLVLLPHTPEGGRTFWTTYQKIELYGRVLFVNNTGYQSMKPQVAATPGEPLTRFTLPFAARPGARSVLVVGAGTGNDVSAALAAGVDSVIAVEIDPTIYRIGQAYHPNQPYSDPRVEVVVDDARHFLATTDRRFDLIVMGDLDAHTLLSSYTNVRLDDYIYTVQAFHQASERLTPDGAVYVTFFAETDFVRQRLARNLTEAFGHEPLALVGSSDVDSGAGWQRALFLNGRPETVAELAADADSWTGYAVTRHDPTAVRASTDEWPFLTLEKAHIPPIITLVSIVIVLLSTVFALRTRPRGEPFDGRVFWLGAAFMLLEVHNVSRLALVFGTTWRVNAWVIGAILGLILLANLVVSRLHGAGKRPGKWAVIGLMVTLALAYFVPLEIFLGMSGLAGGALATLLLTLPIFFAGLVFADAFARSQSPTFALGWNVLGSVVGGLTESLSYVVGIPALVPAATLFYAVALLWPRGRAEQSN